MPKKEGITRRDAVKAAGAAGVAVSLAKVSEGGSARVSEERPCRQ